MTGNRLLGVFLFLLPFAMIGLLTDPVGSLMAFGIGLIAYSMQASMDFVYGIKKGND